jgi:hypothetical protein
MRKRQRENKNYILKTIQNIESVLAPLSVAKRFHLSKGATMAKAESLHYKKITAFKVRLFEWF